MVMDPKSWGKKNKNGGRGEEGFRPRVATRSKVAITSTYQCKLKISSLVPLENTLESYQMTTHCNYQNTGTINEDTLWEDPVEQN